MCSSGRVGNEVRQIRCSEFVDLFTKTKEREMKKLIGAFCFMFALSPLAMAQDKGKADEKKAAPAVTKAEEKKAAPAVVPAPAAASAKAAEKKAAPAAEKKSASAGNGKKEPSEKQLAQRAKMKSCSADAKGKSLKGDERKKFMSTCLKG